MNRVDHERDERAANKQPRAAAGAALMKQTGRRNAMTTPAEHDTDGRFPPGVCGNPQGRPRGSRNRASILVEDLLGVRAQALAEKAIEIALGGDVLALRLCLERLLPARREGQMVSSYRRPRRRTTSRRASVRWSRRSPTAN